MNVVTEIDGLSTLMDAVKGGIAVTVLPGAALARCDPFSFVTAPVESGHLIRLNQLVSLSDDELSPVGLAARVALREVAHELVAAETWIGASLVMSKQVSRPAPTTNVFSKFEVVFSASQCGQQVGQID
jgi:LysR family transcriptional regulator, regulatory protein for tcuABC